MKVVFLDRDGVINQDKGYIYKIEDIEFIDGIFLACQRFIEQGYQIIIVTNQSGIGRGLYTEKDFAHLMKWMQTQFEQHNITLLDVKYCADHPVHGKGKYKKESPYRKPNAQMLLDAARQHKIDLPASIIIGDKHSDVLAGQAAGVGRLLMLKSPHSPDYVDNVSIYSSWSELLAAEFS